MSILSMCCSVVVLILKFGSTSNILSCAFQHWEIPLRIPSVWSFLLESLSLGHLQSFHYSHFPLMFAFTKLLLLESLMVTVSTFTWSIIPSIPALMFDSNFQHFHSSLLNFHLYWPISSFDYLFLQNVPWVCHWETRTQHNYTLYCLCVHWTTDAQWSITNQRTLKRSDVIAHWSWCTSFIYVVICGLKSEQGSL